MTQTQTMENCKTDKITIASMIKKIEKRTIRFDHPLQRKSDLGYFTGKPAASAGVCGTDHSWGGGHLGSGRKAAVYERLSVFQKQLSDFPEYPEMDDPLSGSSER